MHFRNRRKIIFGATTITAAALSGCATPQHTNLLIFGTNTVFGVKVGADATQTPAIQVGYNRQELVLMPLLANTAASNTDGDLLLQPCPAEKAQKPGPPTATLGELSVNCKFIGTQNDARDQDAYSVLASFGTKYDASAGGNPKVGGGIAQYFATGLAARELAKHGSSLVAATESATRAAEVDVESSAAVTDWRFQQNEGAAQVAGNLKASNLTKDQLATKLPGLDAAATSGRAFADACADKTKDECADIVRAKGGRLGNLAPYQWQAAAKFTF